MSRAFLDRALSSFAYLHEAGYEPLPSTQGGMVQFDSNRLRLRVLEETGSRFYVLFSPVGAGPAPEDWFDFELVLRALGRDQLADAVGEATGSLENLATLLRPHLRDIEPLFAKNNLSAAKRRLHQEEDRRAREVFGTDF